MQEYQQTDEHTIQMRGEHSDSSETTMMCEEVHSILSS